MTRKTYSELHSELLARYPDGATRSGVKIDDMVQLRMQNTYNTHLDIAKDMASVMRADMSAYDKDSSQFTQSL
ncbi:MAG: isocitrate lyase, partial [Robiginitomaculum sp.]